MQQWVFLNLWRLNNVLTAKCRKEYQNNSFLLKNHDESNSIFDSRIKSDESLSEEDKHSCNSNEIKFLQEESKHEQIGPESKDEW
jgi:hypothetical protein